MKKHSTLFYLSGTSMDGESYALKHRKRLSNCGVLYSYADLRPRSGTAWKRLQKLKKVDK